MGYQQAKSIAALPEGGEGVLQTLKGAAAGLLGGAAVGAMMGTVSAVGMLVRIVPDAFAGVRTLWCERSRGIKLETTRGRVTQESPHDRYTTCKVL